MDSALFLAGMFASRQQHHTTRLVIIPTTVGTALDDRPDAAAQPVPARYHTAPAQEGVRRSVLARVHAVSLLPTARALRHCTGTARALHWQAVSTFSESTVLWRLHRGRAHAHATLLATAGRATLAWFIDDVMDRAENYDTLELALARADDVRGALERDGWSDASG